MMGRPGRQAELAQASAKRRSCRSSMGMGGEASCPCSCTCCIIACTACAAQHCMYCTNAHPLFDRLVPDDVPLVLAVPRHCLVLLLPAGHLRQPLGPPVAGCWPLLVLFVAAAAADICRDKAVLQVQLAVGSLCNQEFAALLQQESRVAGASRASVGDAVVCRCLPALLPTSNSASHGQGFNC